MGEIMKIRIQRVGSKPSPYLPDEWRAKFAVETFRSITAPVWEQVTELELLWLNSGAVVDE